MKKCLIIGAGQLGSRHLQGLLKQVVAQSIFVVDPSEASLALSKQRALEIEHPHDITWCTSISELPHHIHLAIIATSANVRRMVVEHVMSHCTIDLMILEKVLFQRIDDYEFISQYLAEKKTPAWVNHPRRMFHCYTYLKQELDAIEGKLTMQVEGNNWGLACNGLHLLDLFHFLSNHPVSKIHNEWIDKDCFQSKRMGFVEFYGTIRAESKEGDSCVVTSNAGDPTSLRISVSKGNRHWSIQEGSIVTIIDSNNGEKTFPMQYQSELTSTLATSLFEKNTCVLPSYVESDALHRLFILAFLEIYNTGLDTRSDLLPIT